MTGQSIQQRITTIQREHRFDSAMFECSCQRDLPEAEVMCMDRDEHEAHVTAVLVEALGLTQEWAARFVDGSVTVGSEGTARYCASRHPDTWEAVSRWVTSWESTNG